MILTCPACATRYVIGDGVFQAGAREVRCARCSHRWISDGSDAVDEVDTPVDQQAATPAPKRESAPPPPAAEPVGFGVNDLPGMERDDTAAMDDTVDAEEPPETDEAPPPPSGVADPEAAEAGKPATRPGAAQAGDIPPPARAARRRTPVWVWIGWVVLLCCIGAVAAALILMRAPLVEAWPPLQRLYDTVGAGDGAAAGHETGASAPVQLSVESSELVDDHGKRRLDILIRLTNATETQQPLPIALVYLLREHGETDTVERIRLPADQPLAPKESRVMALRLSDVPAAVTSVRAEAEAAPDR